MSISIMVPGHIAYITLSYCQPSSLQPLFFQHPSVHHTQLLSALGSPHFLFFLQHISVWLFIFTCMMRRYFCWITLSCSQPIHHSLLLSFFSCCIKNFYLPSSITSLPMIMVTSTMMEKNHDTTDNTSASFPDHDQQVVVVASTCACVSAAGSAASASWRISD